MKYLNIDDIEVKDKTIFIRVDLNTTIKNGKPLISPRIKEHAKSIANLALKNAKVVVLAHQGRKGEDDFTALDKHAKLLEKEVKKINKKLKVSFVDDVCGPKAIEKIKSLKPGEILLLQNTRFLDCETEYEKTQKCEIVDNLEPLCDAFVLDAFSVAHRAHASVVGFKKPIKVAGPILQKELEALEKFQQTKEKVVMILGGAKIKDSAKILEYWLENKNVEFVLVGGLVGVFLAKLNGAKIRQTIDVEEEVAQRLRDLLQKHKNKIILPSDFLVNLEKPKVYSTNQEIDFECFDIGPNTIEEFSKIIKQAELILMNGPMGVYEKRGFEKGTKKILEAIANSKAFSLIGGGNSAEAIEKLKLNKKKFGYISLSGKAFIEYLMKGNLVGIEQLKKL
ncbi:MAG: phosphoglycerate kinase [Candidatus Anstonellaceae archaeon]